MFADLISQRRKIGEAEQGWVPEARTPLRKQMTEQQYHRTTPEVHKDTLSDDFRGFTDSMETSLKIINCLRQDAADALNEHMGTIQTRRWTKTLTTTKYEYMKSRSWDTGYLQRKALASKTG